MKSALFRRTRRLEIRPLEKKDYVAWRDAYLTAQLSRNAFDSGPREKEKLSRSKFAGTLLAQRKHRQEGRFYDLGIFHRVTGEHIGRVSVMDVQRGLSQSAYLGYTVFNRHWGNGFGKEAVRAMIDIAFRDLKLHRIEAGIEPYNRRSIFLARSLGLRKEGLKKRAVYLRGKWVDLVMYSATCEEFGVKWAGETSMRPR